MALVFAVTTGRIGVSLRQERFESAPDFLSQDRTGGGASPGVFPVAGAGTLDERQGTGELRAATGRRDRHDPVAGRDPAGPDHALTP